MLKFNAQQINAIKKVSGVVLVLAGAGSGKTTVITHKITYLIKKYGYHSKNILAVTFTNKAAKEMKHRIKSNLDSSLSKGLMVSTFHTLGLNILKKNIDSLGYKNNFTLFDDNDVKTLIKDISYERFKSSKEYSDNIRYQISRWKSDFILPCEVDIIDTFTRESQEVYELYQNYLKAYQCLDFDDLIMLPVKIFIQYPEILKLWQEKIKYILVDEYQDTNICQYKLIKLIAGECPNMTVVGDDDQSIYSWRGAKPENIGLLKIDYPDLEVIKLEQNYRSTNRILKSANALISNNEHLYDKKLWSNHSIGEPILILSSKDEFAEAVMISNLIISKKNKLNIKYSDFAILYRGNHQSFLLEKQLQMYRVPYHINGGTSFFAKSEIKDILSYFRLAINIDDDQSFLRVINIPRREIGPSNLEKISQYSLKRNISLFKSLSRPNLYENLKSRQQNNLYDFEKIILELQNSINIKDVNILKAKIILFIEDLNYHQWLVDSSSSLKQAENKFKNVLNLIDFICDKIQYAEKEDSNFDFQDIINRLLMIDMIDTKDDETNDKVQLLTLHSAKGLEYKIVIMIGMTDGVLPHQTSIDNDEIQEERRLAYVGITRAKEELIISYSLEKNKFSGKQFTIPSRFINELPAEDLSWDNKQANSDKAFEDIATNHLSKIRAMLNKK